MKQFKQGMVPLLASLMLVLAACGNNSNADENNNAAGSTSSGSDGEVSAAAAPVKLSWWHSMSGAGEKAINQIVSDFNASQTGIEVEAVYQVNMMKA